MSAGMLSNVLKHLRCTVIGAELDAVDQRQRVHTVDVGIDKALAALFCH
jgi:hypothetical protein